jgi:hypothetical protein
MTGSNYLPIQLTGMCMDYGIGQSDDTIERMDAICTEESLRYLLKTLAVIRNYKIVHFMNY